MPHHKPCLVVQGRSDEFYIDHDHPFGASSAISNAGMIANTLVDIWMTEGGKYKDDINIFRFPVPDGTLAESANQYYYDCLKVLQRVSRLDVPWHPDKGDPFFSSMSISIGMLWDLGAHHVSLPEKKRLKFLCRVLSSFEGKQCQLRDVERTHGSLCYISFIYQSGRSRLPSLPNFATSFHGNEFIPRYPPRSLTSDLILGYRYHHWREVACFPAPALMEDP